MHVGTGWVEGGVPGFLVLSQLGGLGDDGVAVPLADSIYTSPVFWGLSFHTPKQTESPLIPSPPNLAILSPDPSRLLST